MVFFTWRSAILKSELQSTTKLVLLVISTYMDDHGGGAFPNVKTIASDAGLSERAVCTHIEKAKDAGFILVEKQKLAGREWARNAYKIAFPGNPEVYQRKGTERDSVPHIDGAESQTGRDVQEGKNQGTERRSAPQSDLPHSPDFSDSEVGALNDVQHQNQEGTEPHAEGTEPHDNKALNDVQSNSPVTSPQNSPVNPTTSTTTRAPCDAFAMHLDWLPDLNRFEEFMALRSITREMFSPEALNEFRMFWIGDGRTFRQEQWEHKLASSLVAYHKKLQRLDGASLANSRYGETYAQRFGHTPPAGETLEGECDE